MKINIAMFCLFLGPLLKLTFSEAELMQSYYQKQYVKGKALIIQKKDLLHIDQNFNVKASSR